LALVEREDYDGRKTRRLIHQPELPGNVSLESTAPSRFPRALGGHDHFERRHVDAKRRCGVVDDVAVAVVGHGRARADGDELAGVLSRAARRGAGRCGGPPAPAAPHAKLDAADGHDARRAYVAQSDDAMDVVVTHVFAWR